MNWYFDGSNLNEGKEFADDYMDMTKGLKVIYDCFVSVGFSKSEAMQMLTTILLASVVASTKKKK